ncbi:malate dehydrogenase, partial [Candidatus Woesearchaeota archaeon]|nr:malate dehydrogenase [Candidatus Woesearchaeota archaeon]
DDLIEKIVDETAKGGAEIVGFLKTGSAFYGPGDAIKTMVESIIKDDGKIVCAAAYLSGEYGYNGIFLGVPIRLGSNGVREIVEVSLPDDIKEKLDEAAEAAKKLSLSK